MLIDDEIVLKIFRAEILTFTRQYLEKRSIGIGVG